MEASPHGDGDFIRAREASESGEGAFYFQYLGSENHTIVTSRELCVYYSLYHAMTTFLFLDEPPQSLTATVNLERRSQSSHWTDICKLSRDEFQRL